MNIVLSKTVVFISFIVIGFILKLKFNSKEETDGLKKIILNLALPATIFLALLQINVKSEYLWLPVMALALNLAVFFVLPWFMKLIGISKDSDLGRTARMLIPSLAPGLSCFPFVLEFLGPEYLAKAAMADLGNKLFVLLILYLVAVSWFRKHMEVDDSGESRASKLITLLKKMLYEPVNIMIVTALVLLFLKIKLNDFPVVLQDIFNRLSIIMTPLVLLYIGLALKIEKGQSSLIFSLLTFRAGLAMFLTGLCVTLFGIELRENILLMLAFAMSACSFWPFMHIAMIDSNEKKLGITKNKTFNSTFAIAILAFSLPFSVILILLILNSGELFVSSVNIFISAILMVGISFLPKLISYLKYTLTHSSENIKSLKINEIISESEGGN